MQITRDMLEEFFQNTREFNQGGQAKFDIDSECRWSYFFADTSERKLTEVGTYLESEGYEPVGFLEPDADDEDPDIIFLRVDMVETHTVDSLHERNQAFYALAEKYAIVQYDGMDVGEIDGII